MFHNFDVAIAKHTEQLDFTLLSCVPLAASCSSCSSILKVLIFKVFGGVLVGKFSREPFYMYIYIIMYVDFLYFMKLCYRNIPDSFLLLELTISNVS